MWIIVYKADGSDLNLTTRHIGPFVDYMDAEDYLTKLAPPINGGHKFIEQLEEPE